MEFRATSTHHWFDDNVTNGVKKWNEKTYLDGIIENGKIF